MGESFSGADGLIDRGRSTTGGDFETAGPLVVSGTAILFVTGEDVNQTVATGGTWTVSCVIVG
jgi:hypothetical protein